MPTFTKGQKNQLSLTDEINSILESKQKDRYFEGIAILHSFIEDMLKWLLFIQIIWNKSSEVTAPEEVVQLRNYCNQMNFNSLLNVGLAVGLLDFKLFKKLESIRTERNSLVHQYWLYIHKGQRQIFRKKLEKLANTSNELVECFNRLVEETGLDDSFFKISTGRKFIVL